MVHFQTRYASWIAAVALPIGILVVGQERIREQHRSFAAEYSERELQIAMLRTENRGFTETVGGKTSMDEGTAGSSSGSESLGGRAELVSPGPDAYRLVAGMAEANKITIVSKDNLFVPQDNLRLRPEFADFFGLTDREFADIEREFAALANQGAILFRANSQLVSPAESEVAPGTGAERHSIQIAIDPPDSIAELRNRFEETVARILGPDRFAAFSALQSRTLGGLPGAGGSMMEFFGDFDRTITVKRDTGPNGQTTYQVSWQIAMGSRQGANGITGEGSLADREAVLARLGIFAPLLPADW